jgi:hypothetical protein
MGGNWVLHNLRRPGMKGKNRGNGSASTNYLVATQIRLSPAGYCTMAASLAPDASRRRVGSNTDPDFLTPLQNLWKASDFMCSHRPLAVTPSWLLFYEQSVEPLSAEVRSRFHSISRATLDRVLKPLRAKYHKGLSGMKPGSMLHKQIPIRTDNWDNTQPGFMKADTVAHCGTRLAGEFVRSHHG